MCVGRIRNSAIIKVQRDVGSGFDGVQGVSYIEYVVVGPGRLYKAPLTGRASETGAGRVASFVGEAGDLAGIHRQVHLVGSLRGKRAIGDEAEARLLCRGTIGIPGNDLIEEHGSGITIGIGPIVGNKGDGRAVGVQC